jgi:hypothetical protein
MEKKNGPVYIFFAALLIILGALVFSILSDYAATAETGRLFRHLATACIVTGAGLLVINYARG